MYHLLSPFASVCCYVRDLPNPARDRLVSLRRQVVPHLLPPLEEDYCPDIDPEAHLEDALIDVEPVKAGLKDCGRYSDRLDRDLRSS